MKHWLLLCLLLCACAPYQKAGNDKSGQPYVVQHAGFWSKTKGVIQKADNGTIHLEQMVEEQDGVVGPQGLADGVVSAVASYGLFSQNKSADTNAAKVSANQTNQNTKVKLKQLDNDALGIQGANKVNELKATPK